MRPAYLIIALLLCCVACQPHFLKEEEYRAQVQQQFQQRKGETQRRAEALYSVFDRRDLSLQQREALEFLYAYMPLCDLTDYDGDFFLRQVDAAFRARDYFTWGKQIPDDIFRHFVLVYRVNNEYLDTARMVFFDALKDRVKNLSMYEAALEVNHWCHEKVIYRGTDGRTSAPLALMRTSWGRCGEESTFTVTALRAVGIPARQCYTPRWVHTDDNHAWVEVWVDGKWHFLGACEPEPALDMAWFTAPAKRAMMVHTTVFGSYTGPEEKNLETPLYSVINLLGHYALTRHAAVQVVDAKGRPVPGAKVQFKVYNYAELYPVVTVTADSLGRASVLTGMGDLMVWGSHDGCYGYGKSIANGSVAIVRLDRRPGAPYEETYMMEVPKAQAVPSVATGKQAENARRLAQEDSLRNDYMQTFATEYEARDRAQETGLEPFYVWKYMQQAQGNWREIAAFMKARENDFRIFPFMATLSEKDLRDTPAAVLEDHLSPEPAVTGDLPGSFVADYVLSPRIATVLIKPWRSFFRQEHVAAVIAGTPRSAAHIARFVRDSILRRDADNYYNCLSTPQGVYELRMADGRSRQVFFVAACRSLGFPARIAPATGMPQYYDIQQRQWVNAELDKTDAPVNTLTAQVRLTLRNHPSNIVKPQYESHYTLAVYRGGDFHTLDLYRRPELDRFPAILSLDEGYYRLMTGARASDGTVRVHTKYFNLTAGKPQQVTVQLFSHTDRITVLGALDMNTEVHQPDAMYTLSRLARGKGLILSIIDPGKEPSRHVEADLQLKALDSWGGGKVFLNRNEKTAQALLAKVRESLNIEFAGEYPLTLYISTGGGILFYSKGYRIGIGEDLLKVIKLEQKK